MARKTTSSTKPATPAQPEAPAKPAAKPAAKKKTVAAKTKPAAKAPAAKKPAYTTDDVALRAYFIAEKRLTDGLPGDEHQDWIEAERQLAAESKAAKKKKA
jgi:hypothetical protein